jgi:membrane-associated protease RseP (regulator of RpoE activity)
MGYRLLSQEDGASLPHNGGALGMDIERAQHITDDGLAFDIIRVKQVRPGSPGAQAGFRAGDQIIAVDGRVFASLTAFGAYVGSLQPGTQIKVDYIPAGGGPQQAQRLVATVGQPGRAAPAGLSTGTKIAIGVGAAALFGCYELGCFSHRARPQGQGVGQQQRQP